MRPKAKLALVALPVLLVFLSAVMTAAAAPPPKTLTSYCSSSGDVCFGILTRGGKVSLELTTAAKYFPRYTLCVRRVRPAGGGAEAAQRCGSFPVFRQAGSTWGSRVNYARQYPVHSAGRYRVTWKLASGPLGPSLYLRLPLS